MGRSPFLRRLTVRLPQSMQPAPARSGQVVEVGSDGQPLRSLHDPTGVVANVTSVMELGAELFLGSHQEPSIAVVQVAVTGPPAFQEPAEAALE
jgi:hypothetical protein